jgi:3-hydroxyisobutyrate dehydrogenase
MSRRLLSSSASAGTVGFIGLGNMGCSMALNLIKKGVPVMAFDLFPASVDKVVAGGGVAAKGLDDLAANCKTIITMLPSSPHVAGTVDTLLEGGWAKHGGMLIDSSTIDPLTTRAIQAKLAEHGVAKVDAPVSGGVKGAAAGTLTFMVGGSDAELSTARPLLEAMGANIVHCGDSGAGQSAKLCNNMAMGIQMIGVSEALNLGEKLGLEPKVLASIMNTSTSRCWSSDSYNPHPDVLEGVPSTNNYAGGFGVSLMLKDLKLATSAASAVGSPCPLGNATKELYSMTEGAGMGGKDFGVVLQYLKGNKIE